MKDWFLTMAYGILGQSCILVFYYVVPFMTDRAYYFLPNLCFLVLKPWTSILVIIVNSSFCIQFILRGFLHQYIIKAGHYLWSVLSGFKFIILVMLSPLGKLHDDSYSSTRCVRFKLPLCSLCFMPPTTSLNLEKKLRALLYIYAWLFWHI